MILSYFFCGLALATVSANQVLEGQAQYDALSLAVRELRCPLAVCKMPPFHALNDSSACPEFASCVDGNVVQLNLEATVPPMDGVLSTALAKLSALTELLW